METRVKIAQLDQPGLSKLKALEAELGAIIVAYKKAHAVADLRDEQLARL